MADETNAAQAVTAPTPPIADPAKPTTDEPSNGPPAAVHSVEQPLGTEFSLSVHESIAKKFEAKVEEVCYAIETDVKNGVHRLKGWLKIS